MIRFLSLLALCALLITPAPAQSGQNITLLHFWATWCGPCVMELPELDKLAVDYAGKNLTILTISEDDDGAPAVDKFLAEHPQISHLKIMYDQAPHPAGRKLNIGAIPVSILIGPDGKEIKRYTGATEWNSPKVRHDLDQLLAGAN